MRIGMLGTGVVGQTLGSKLIEVGHEVRMGSRDAANEKASEWVASTGGGASNGTLIAGDHDAFVCGDDAGAKVATGHFNVHVVR